MFKISFSKLCSDAFSALKRFSGAGFTAVIGTGAAIYNIDFTSGNTHFFLNNLIHTSILSFAFLISGSIFCEARKLSKSINLMIQIGGIGLSFAYYFYLPQQELPEIYYFRSALLFIFIHLAVSFAPYIFGGTQNDFWEYNKKLFINILTSALYTGVLYGGLTLAILAVDKLFHVNFNEKIYSELWIFMIGIFNSWFFLSKFPDKYNEQQTEYPNALRLFTQYVLLPLVTIYLLILYLYEIKIIGLWQLPVGWVSYLIIGFSILGILALLLVYPLQNNEKFKWVGKYTKSFYFALFPLILLLFVAIGKRISEYGITENRYFILILAVWLLGISIYMLINRLENIKIIPVSLACIALFSAAGPQSAFNVAKRSQFSRLEKLLEKNKVLKNGKLIPFEKQPSDSIKREISSIIGHFAELYDYKTLRKDFAQINLQLPDTTVSQYQVSDLVMNKLGFKNSGTSNETGFNYYVDKQSTEISQIEGYKSFIDYNEYFDERNDTLTIYKIKADSVEILYNTKTNRLKLNFSDKTNLELNVDSLIRKYSVDCKENYKSIRKNDLIIETKTKKMKAKILITSVSGNKTGEKIQITSLNAFLFYTK
jgi:hypothetical protein